VDASLELFLIPGISEAQVEITLDLSLSTPKKFVTKITFTKNCSQAKALTLLP
jgi:hypothetical protein